mgnify:CR=1 FL=1
MLQRIEHTIPPVFNSGSRILILGTIPSPKSREAGFYYGHPHNRFWTVLSALLNRDVPDTITEKKSMLLQKHIALWDVLASCEISGADAVIIRDPQPNRIEQLLAQSAIQAIFTTGKKAYTLYQVLCYPATSKEAAYLRMVESYRIILPFLEREPKGNSNSKQKENIL